MEKEINFGTWLREKRRLKGLTVEKFAEKLDVSKQTVYFYEQNKMLPALKNVKKIAKILGETQHEVAFQLQLQKMKIEKSGVKPQKHLSQKEIDDIVQDYLTFMEEEKKNERN